MNTLEIIYPLLATLVAYLMGSLSFAVIVSRTLGLNDPRTYGSKNPGATNVLRSGSKAAAIVTLILDAAKGWLPVALVHWYGQPYGLEEGSMALVGLAAFVGHLYPVFFKFVGGKGVATALGVLLGISGWLALATLIGFALVVYVTRYVSLASVMAAVLAPVIYFLGGDVVWGMDGRIALSIVLMSALLVWRHAENISRLMKGAESKLGKKG